MENQTKVPREKSLATIIVGILLAIAFIQAAFALTWGIIKIPISPVKPEIVKVEVHRPEINLPEEVVTWWGGVKGQLGNE